MKKQLICALAVSFALCVSSCKKEEVTIKVDPNGKVISGTGLPLPPGSRPDREIPKDGKYPKITFERLEHDFGTINQGDVVSTTFKFTNSGEADLVIQEAHGSCGCTVPEFPKEPIHPGASAEIKVSFNSAGKHGKQSKTVTLSTNTKSGQDVVTITSNVEEKK
ncbi:DUF1573 domain-containing protein [Flavobacterium silvaticum]|uniref:DUF1573 domain-containing protein n=1 Tax=Flavobacterium silvaticum TaxID=1852020 RepID=A0A972FUQ4_9FLAO|nr:DUF1573 domain-containing protein [Flavobacterium silvaticum]NMH27965.1 DUF1573 domain-containing protein [Flavobacterium silvaticum]